MQAPAAEEDESSARLKIPGDQMAVRNGLRALFDTLLLRSMAEFDRGTAEIVLAEALNNIVEHAYATSGGEIEITLQLRRNELVCTILDRGAPMPDGRLPEGRPQDLAAVQDLPEGGFGWHLIRAMSHDLQYSRQNNCNRLQFRLDTTQSTR